MKFFWDFLVCIFYVSSVFLVGITNPIHSLLLLINVFLIGSLFLFCLDVEFFGLIFFMVYIGAIVVLFLFVVMMLDIKISSISVLQRNFYTSRLFISLFLLIEILFLSWSNIPFFDAINKLNNLQNEKMMFTFYVEYYDYFQILKTITHMESLGFVLFTYNIFPFLIAGILLLISMIGAIVLTIEDKYKINYKQQNISLQTLKVFREYRKIYKK